MKLLRWTTTAIILCSVLIPSVRGSESVTPASIVKAISEAKILAPGYKLNAAIYPNAREVIVSTYANEASKDVVADCKVDAVLIARKVTEASPQTLRVKVRFYQPNQKSYQEVAVTKPEIAAFSSGAVHKDELLQSLEVVTVDGASQSTSGASEGLSAPHPTETAAPSGSSNGALKPSQNLNVYRKSGLMFYYPKTWGSKEMSNQWGDFVELTRNSNGWASIIFRLQDKESPEQAAFDENKYYWSSHQIVPVMAPKTVLIGSAKNIQAQVYYLKDNGNAKDPDRFEKHVYFGYKHRIYSMSVRFSRTDHDSVNADLNTILGTIVRE
jgi:hypothetical protein